MPNLTKEEQHALGARLAAVIEPLPRDQRLLALLAGFYGESRSQGLSADGMLQLAQRVITLHEQGVSVILPGAYTGVCSLCNWTPGAWTGRLPTHCPNCGGAL
jgi:hypothetical protein